MSSESWPPALKDWVAKCLGQMTDSNRTEAQAELRQVISDAFSGNTLWTTDWAGVQLQSLLPKPALNLTNLKRKNDIANSGTKKSKKSKTAQQADPFNDQDALNRRAARFRREHELELQKSQGQRNGGGTPLKANSSIAHLFNNNWSNSRGASPFGGNPDDPEADPNVIDWDRFTIVGTSQETFKDYLRLTSEPKPEQIRPYVVLQRTLVELKKRWKEKASYSWICNQFKSLRQDLTVRHSTIYIGRLPWALRYYCPYSFSQVQRIKNEFTVQVYEIHARMALESGDMVEYNQCQATLKALYELGIPGKVEEFTGYRILMLLHGRNHSELNLYIGQLTPRQKADPAVKHALSVQRAQSLGNYHSLFALYINAPNMGAYIMDHFIDRERIRALMVISKAYRTIPVEFIQNELAFDSPAHAREFLIAHGISFFANPNAPDPEKVLDCRPAMPKLSQVYEDKFRRVGIRGAV